MKITKSQLKKMIQESVKEAVLKEQSSNAEGVLQHLSTKLKQVDEEIRVARYNASARGRGQFRGDEDEASTEYQESILRIKKAVNYMQSLVAELEQL